MRQNFSCPLLPERIYFLSPSFFFSCVLHSFHLVSCLSSWLFSEVFCRRSDHIMKRDSKKVGRMRRSIIVWHEGEKDWWDLTKNKVSTVVLPEVKDSSWGNWELTASDVRMIISITKISFLRLPWVNEKSGARLLLILSQKRITTHFSSASLHIYLFYGYCHPTYLYII